MSALPPDPSPSATELDPSVRVESIDHLHIYSLDPEASVAFWQAHFGAQKVMTTMDIHDQEVHIVCVGNQNLAFSEPLSDNRGPRAPSAFDPSQGRLHGAGVAHLGLNVRSVRQAVDALSTAGVTIHAEPQTAHGVTFAYVEAPDGVLVELTEY